MIGAVRRLSAARWAPHILLTAAAAALFALGLGTHPIGRDEAVSVLAARHSIPDLIDLVIHHEPHPAGYYLVLSLWPHDTLLGARLFSFLPGVLCVPVIIATARRLELPAWSAGILAATSPFLGFYSVEARMYSWLAFTGALALLVTAAITRSEGRRLGAAVLLGGVLATAAYVHYFAFFLGLAAVGGLLLQRRRLEAAVATGTAALLFSPGLLMLAEQVPVLRRYPTGTWQAKEDPAHIFQAFSVLLAGAESYIPAFVATAILIVVLDIALIRGRRDPGTRMAGYWLLPTMALPLLVGVFVPLDSPRYLAAAFPALVLLLASATRGLPVSAAVAVTGALALIGAGLVVDSFQRPDNTKPPVPAALALGGPGRLIVAQHLLLAPEVAFYVNEPVAYDFNAPTIDRIGYWALPPGAEYPPPKPQPLLIVNYCGRLQPPPPGYVIERKVHFDMNLCAELVNPT